MADPTQTQAQIQPGPRLTSLSPGAGAAELAAAGFVSGGTRANTERMRGFAVLDAAIPAELAVLLHDAQTSGGLLLAAPATAPALLGQLRAQGLPAALIGDIVPGESGHVHVHQDGSA